jgi:hypothetical protein
LSDLRENWKPVPDPTTLTTEQLRRELLSLRELLTSEMTRIELVHEEKFRGIETRLGEGKTALEAAFRAAQNLVDVQNKANSEAGEKSERSFTKQIESLNDVMMTKTNAMSDQLSDIKVRLSSGEGVVKGATDNSTRIMAGIILAVSLVTAAYTISSHNQPPPTVVSPAVVPLNPK